MRTRVLLIALTLLAACFVAPDDHSLGSAPLDGGLGGAGAIGGGSGGGTGGGEAVVVTRCVDGYLGLNETVCAPIHPIVCGGATCAAGQVCCQTTGVCVAPGSAACPAPATTTWPGGATPCASSADCEHGEFCMSDDLNRCLGGGHCQPTNNCGYCGPPGDDQCKTCGCDGVTYESTQAACVAGVRTVFHGACGTPPGRDAGPAPTVSCGTSQQCPSGAQCCFLTGKCFDSTEPWRCEVQPDGSILDCATNEECTSRGAGGGSGTSNTLCLGAGAGCTGPGHCASRGSSNSCGGEVQPVCGCDRITYVNACWATAAGTRVISGGACP